MPGLIVASFDQDSEAAANTLFDTAKRYYLRTPGLKCGSDERQASVRVARITHQHSRHTTVVLGRPSGQLVAVAGWCFSRDYPQGRSLDLAAEVEQHGLDGVWDRLDGQYAFVASDGERTIASGDCGGFYPCYVAEQDGVAWFSTSATSLAYALRRDFDALALNALWFGTAVRSPRSMYAGIRRLSIGEKVSLCEGKLKITRAWSPFQHRQHTDVQEAAEEGLAILGRVCQQAHHDFPKLCCDLTSGLDTRLLAAGFHSQGIPIDANVCGPEGNVDVVGARNITSAMGWPLTHASKSGNWAADRWPYFQLAVRLLDGEISAHLGEMPLYLRSQLQAAGYAATAQGGGGEFFREFPWEHILWRRGRTSKLNLAWYAQVRMFLRNQAPMRLFAHDWRTEFINDQIHVMREIVDVAPDAMNTEKLDALYLWRQSGHFGRWLGTSFHVLPSIAPLMTRDLLEFAFRVPARLRTNASLTRHMITRASPRLAKFPTCWGGTAEPMGIRHPVRSTPFWMETAKRWTDKIATVALGRSFLADPDDPVPNHRPDDEFIDAIHDRGLWNTRSWLSEVHYQGDELANLVHDVRCQRQRNKYGKIFALLTLELLSREIIRG